MRKTDENFAIRRCGGFTLIELLVVIAIIMMLIGILVPGMQAIKRLSKNLQQKSLFHSLEISIELFSKDFDDYPDSKRAKKPSGSLYYCGAQHLAEAMLGRDEKGYEPVQNGKWYWPGDPAGTALELYESTSKSLNRRKKTYIVLKDTGVHVPNDIYDPAVVAAGNLYSDAGAGKPGERGTVFTDVFLKKKITLAAGGTIKVGSPILYYRANRSSRLFKKAGPAVPGNTDKWIYDYNDNRNFIDLGTVADPSVPHLMNEKLFYETVANPAVSFDKPFNSTTFILISAGNDGIFGTKDDVTNFDY